MCEVSDSSRLYKLARQGKIKRFTGIDDPYEAPEGAEVVLEHADQQGALVSPEAMAAAVTAFLESHGHLQVPTRCTGSWRQFCHRSYAYMKEHVCGHITVVSGRAANAGVLLYAPCAVVSCTGLCWSCCHCRAVMKYAGMVQG